MKEVVEDSNKNNLLLLTNKSGWQPEMKLLHRESPYLFWAIFERKVYSTFTLQWPPGSGLWIWIQEGNIWRKNRKNARKLVVVVSKFVSALCFFTFQQSFLSFSTPENSLYGNFLHILLSRIRIRIKKAAGSGTAKNECGSTAPTRV